MAPRRAQLLHAAAMLLVSQLNTLIVLFQFLLFRRRRIAWMMDRVRRRFQLIRRSRSRAFLRFSARSLSVRGFMATLPRRRRWWMRPRAQELWWGSVVMATWDDEQWLAHFRMRKQTLLDLAEVLGPHIQRSGDTRYVISVPERVGMTIWWLSSPLNYRKVAIQFGRGVSTVAGVVMEVCLAMEVALLPIAVGIRDPARDIPVKVPGWHRKHELRKPH